MKAKVKVVKVRQVKDYPDAKNHIMVGEVIAETLQYLKMKCRTFTFPTLSGYRAPSAIKVSSIKTRWIPWCRIAVVTELTPDFDWEGAEFEVLDNDLRLAKTALVPDENDFSDN